MRKKTKHIRKGIKHAERHTEKHPTIGLVDDIGLSRMIGTVEKKTKRPHYK